MKIEINETHNFKHIIADDGMVMTDWDKADILEYNSSREMYCPMTMNENALYEITEEEDAAYRAEQEIAIAEMEKKNRPE